MKHRFGSKHTLPPGFLTERMACPGRPTFCLRRTMVARSTSCRCRYRLGADSAIFPRHTGLCDMVRWWSELGFIVKKGDKFVEDERNPIAGRPDLSIYAINRSSDIRSAVRLFKNGGIELVSLKQFVKFRTIAFGQARCLRHVAASNLQHAYQIVPFETLARIFKRNEVLLFPVHRVIHQHRRDQGSCTQDNASLDHVHQLPHVTRP